MNYYIAAIIGLVSGVTSGLFGVGGGIIMVPAMVYLLSPPVRDIKQAIGTSLVIIIPTAIMGSYKHYTQSNIEWRTVLAIAPLAVAGSYLGAWLTTQVHADNLKRGFGGFIILIGVNRVVHKTDTQNSFGCGLAFGDPRPCNIVNRWRPLLAR